MQLRHQRQLIDRMIQMKHRFVEFIPQKLEEGTLYVSMEYGTASHLCCCGCGREVVTPLTPTDWELTYNGVSISLSPSIGSWSLPCRSHYWIRRGRIKWAGPWSDSQVAEAIREDQQLKEEFYCPKIASVDSVQQILPPPTRRKFWPRLWQWIRKSV